MRIIVKYFIVISIILLYSCDTSTEPSKDRRIFPLNKGNIWIYQNYMVKSDGSFTKYSLDTNKVLKDTIVNDLKFYLVRFSNTVLDFGYINDSLFIHVDPNYTFLKPYLIYSYPCQKGDFYFGAFGACKVVNIDTTITVQAGTFKCIKYKYYTRIETGEGIDNYHYCSPGVGLIKIETYQNSYSQLDVFKKTWMKELISYNIKD
jgi:hypothetical protein